MGIFAPQQGRADELTSSGVGSRPHPGGGANVAGVAWKLMRSSAPPARAEGAPQTLLAVGEAGDAQEVEADRVSDEIMRMPAGAGAKRGSLDGEAGGQGGEEGAGSVGRQVRRVAAVNTGLGPAVAPPSVERVLRSPGEMLDLSTRAFMEPRFGRDLSWVRVHLDEAAQTSARDVDARAYTVGSNIVFGAGQFAPQTEAGRKLIAHEVTHTLQQEGGAGGLQRAPLGAGRVAPSAPGWLGSLRGSAVHVQGEIWSVDIPGLGPTWVGPYGRLSAYINKQGLSARLEAAHIIGREHLEDIDSGFPGDDAPCVAVDKAQHAIWTERTTALQQYEGGRATAKYERPDHIGRREVVELYDELYQGMPELQEMARNIVRLPGRKANGRLKVPKVKPVDMSAKPSPVDAHSRTDVSRGPSPMDAHSRTDVSRGPSPMDAHSRTDVSRGPSPMDAHTRTDVRRGPSPIDAHAGTDIDPVPVRAITPEVLQPVAPESTRAQFSLPEFDLPTRPVRVRLAGVVEEIGPPLVELGINILLTLFQTWLDRKMQKRIIENGLEDVKSEIDEKLKTLKPDIARWQLLLDEKEKAFAVVTVEVAYWNMSLGAGRGSYVEPKVRLADVQISSRAMNSDRSFEREEYWDSRQPGQTHAIDQSIRSFEVQVFSDQELAQFRSLEGEYLSSKFQLARDPYNPAFMADERRLRELLVHAYGKSLPATLFDRWWE